MSDDKDAINRLGAVFVDSYFIVDRDLRMQAFNPAFPALLGLRGGERRKLLNSFCYDYLKLEICQERCIALEALKKNGAVHMNEIHGQKPDGTEMILELSAIPLKNANGEVDTVLVTHRDVTDERRLKERYLEEQDHHKKERAALLRIIEDRDVEIENIRAQHQEAEPWKG
jgi:sigma-54 dependent transcriptional regulator, acetoin dehydrogenase operon transcriptional activator AcoR